jgi:hypothetical protein
MAPILTPILSARRSVSEDSVTKLFGAALSAHQALELGLVDLVEPMPGGDSLSRTVLSELESRGLLDKTAPIRPLDEIVIDEASRRRRAATAPGPTAVLLTHLTEDKGPNHSNVV